MSAADQLAGLLDALDIDPAEHVSVCYAPPGGPLAAAVTTADNAPPVAAALAEGRDVWFGVCPVRGDLPPGRRGTAADVLRVPALWADLDAKTPPAGMGTPAGCTAVVDKLAGLLRAQPAAVVGSGTGGVHPYWRLTPYPPAEHRRALSLLRRWGVLVRAVAAEHGGGADNVFDAARVLRVPGTTNHKPGGGPVVLELAPPDERDTLTLDDLEDALLAAGIRDEPAPDRRAAEPVAPADWPTGSRTCAYVARMRDGWTTDTPTGGRHPWLVSQAVRLASAARLGCVTPEDAAAARRALAERFATIVATVAPARAVAPYEVAGAFAWAWETVAGRTEEAAHAELGHHHRHDDTDPEGDQLAGLLPPGGPPGVDPETGEIRDEPAPDLDDDRAATLAQFPRLNLAALLDPNRPPREWVLAGLIPAGASVSLVSPAGGGKSLLALSSSLAVARGDRAFADLGIPRRRRVLYVDMENTADDLAERFAALGIRPADDLGDFVFLHLPALDPLDTPRGGRQLDAIVDAYGLARGDLVVLDSMQRVTSGAENDADTMRAFYVCTALPLKRRGLTVLRTDNTGKDADKGARGTSGKRDDVDVELILTRDAEHAGRLRITPGKVRIPDVRQLLLSRDVDEDGRLTYSSAGDPFRALVLAAWQALDALDPEGRVSQREAEKLLKDKGHKIPRAAVRAALKERHACG